MGVSLKTEKSRAWPKAEHCAVASSLFCFEGDPHGLSHPFQKAAKLLPRLISDGLSFIVKVWMNQEIP